MGCRVPRTPHVDGHVDGTVSIALSFGSEVEHVRYEHSGNAFLVSGDIPGSIQPCDCATDRSFKLTDSNREPVDKENDIKPFPTFCLRIHPLICDNVFVQSKVLFTHCPEETDGYHATILAEWIGVFLEDHLLKNLILGDEVMGLNGEDNGSQFIYDLICTRRVFCDLWVQSNQGFFHHRLDQHIRMHPRQLFGRDVLPTVALQGGNDHLLNGVIFVKSRCHIISSIVCQLYSIKSSIQNNGLKTTLIGFPAERLASLPRLPRWYLCRISGQRCTFQLEHLALQAVTPELPAQ